MIHCGRSAWRAGTALAATALLATLCQAEVPTISDIVTSRRIDGLLLSPDGKRVAYRLVIPSLTANRIEVQWRERSLSGESDSTDVGPAIGPLMKPLFSFPLDGAAEWGPGEQSLFVLAPDSHGVQVHRLSPGGSDERVTDDPGDIVDFSVDPAKTMIRYEVGNSRASISTALATEARQGIHVDRAVITDGLRLTDNFDVGGRLTTIRRLGLYDQAGEPNVGSLRTERLSLVPAYQAQTPVNGQSTGTGVLDANLSASTEKINTPNGVTLHIASETSNFLGPQWDRHVAVATTADGHRLTCSQALCQHEDESLRELTFNPHTGEIILLLATWSAPTRIVAWNPATGKVRSLYDQQTFLNGGTIVSGAGCPRADHYLICVEAGATFPERLIRLDLDDGFALSLDDPNSELRAKTFPPIRALQWLDPDGRRSTGMLVLPADGPRKRLPLVVTTYRCEAFLRGGSAWLAPEIILAQHGMAALCTNSPDTHWDDKDSAGAPVPLAAHKFYLATLKLIIDRLAREGVIDPSRVGISGHSFSANMVAYAISHTNIFRAAVLGGGFGIDPSGYSLTAGTADSWRKNVYEKLGLPSPNDDPHHVWDIVSPTRSATKTSAALLMQLPESEYAITLDYYAALQDSKIPSDMYVYPNEGHMIEAEPLHQYWRNLRSIDWFEFWLLGRENRTADSAAQFDHWEQLRREDRRPTLPLQAGVVQAPRDTQDAIHASTSTKVMMRE